MLSDYSLKFTQKAENHLDEIYKYVSSELKAESAAENLMDKFEIGIMKLKKFPSSGSTILDKPLKDRGYRKLVINNYIVFYLVNELVQQVVIMRILYGASNYQDVL